jgi:1-acyl-sn-glycerol-3-phosphate acyltransferase
MNQAAVVAGIVDPGRVKAWAAGRPGSAIPAIALRAAGRAFCVVFFSAIALLEIAVTLSLLSPTKRRTARAVWLHRWCRFARLVLGLRLTTTGSIPRSGLLVCNHLSYLDIIALSSLRPCVFVAKRDVRAWPLFGWLARAGGTIFVERNRRLAATIELSQIRAAIESGLLVVLFPEGTSSDGATVLPFKSSLLQAAVSSGCPIAPAGITYRLARGSVANEVCYWRDMTLVPHLLNLFGKPHIESTIRFSSPKPRICDRKALARELRAEVAALRL